MQYHTSLTTKHKRKSECSEGLFHGGVLFRLSSELFDTRYSLTPQSPECLRNPGGTSQLKERGGKKERKGIRISIKTSKGNTELDVSYFDDVTAWKTERRRRRVQEADQAAPYLTRRRPARRKPADGVLQIDQSAILFAGPTQSPHDGDISREGTCPYVRP